MVLTILACLAAAIATDPASADNRDEVGPVDPGATSTNNLWRSVNTGPLALAEPSTPLDEPLVTDRPDFTESTKTIPAGHLQIEAGYTLTYNRDAGVRTKTHTFPETLLRVGVAEDLELRIAWEGWTRSEDKFRERNDVGRRVSTSDVTTGGSDLSLGIKYHVCDQDGFRPDFGVIVAMDLPAGHDSRTSGDVDPFVGLLWAYDLTEDTSIAGNFNIAAPTDGGSRYVETSASLSLGYALTDELGAYVEYFGFYPAGAHQSDAHFINGGLTYQFTNNFQVDVRLGTGLNDESDDLFAGIGFSYRF